MFHAPCYMLQAWCLRVAFHILTQSFLNASLSYLSPKEKKEHTRTIHFLFKLRFSIVRSSVQTILVFSEFLSIACVGKKRENMRERAVFEVGLLDQAALLVMARHAWYSLPAGDVWKEYL